MPPDRFCQLGHGTAETRLICVGVGVRLVRGLLLCEGCAADAERKKKAAPAAEGGAHG